MMLRSTSADRHKRTHGGQDFTDACTAKRSCSVDNTPSPSSARGDHSFSTSASPSLKSNISGLVPPPLSQSRQRHNKRTTEEAAFETERSTLGSERKRTRPCDSGQELEVHPQETDATARWVIDEAQQWTEHVKNYTMTGAQQRRGSLKRSASRTGSYKQSITNGDSPYAWTAKHQEEMAYAGVVLSEQPDIAMAPEDQELCNMILSTKQDCPKEWLYQRPTMLQVVAAAEPRNEARVVRDIGPFFFPAPEVEHLRGHSELQHITEGLGASWSKCTVWCGPTPKPDGTHAISRFLFSMEERNKLIWNNTSACEKGFFPFYICEAKSSDRSLDEAKRQAMHSASVAAKTVIELYEQISAAGDLDRRVLAFSVAHNHQTAEISAYFPIINDEQHTFHRKVLHVVDLKDADADWQAGYRIAFGIWRHFFPKHLARVRNALSKQPDRGMTSFAAQLGLEDDAASAVVSSVPSSHEDDSSKRRALLPTARIEEENARLKALEGLMERLQQQLERQQQESHEMLQNHRQEAREREAELIKREAELIKRCERQEAQMIEQQKQTAIQQERIIELLLARGAAGMTRMG